MRPMESRTIVVVSDHLAYASGHVVAAYLDPRQLEAFLEKYRRAGWWIVDRRPRATAA